MCRLLAFQSVEPVPLADLLLRPSNSLRQQASDAVCFTPWLPPNPARNRAVNPDGHGFGYYAGGAPPTVYRSPLPAWTDPGLEPAVGDASTAMLLAHVRAASPGLPKFAPDCCQPFRFGRMLFTENGGIGGFKPGGELQAALQKEMDPDVLAWLGNSVSDTAHVFAIFLTVLRRRGGRPGEACNPPALLAAALREAVRWIGLIQLASDLPREKLASSFNLCLADGACILATRGRCAFGPEGFELQEAPSLYFAHGTRVWFDEGAGDLRLKHDGGRAKVAVVSSEPLVMGDVEGFSDWGFEVVDDNSMVIVERRTYRDGSDYLHVQRSELFLPLQVEGLGGLPLDLLGVRRYLSCAEFCALCEASFESLLAAAIHRTLGHTDDLHFFGEQADLRPPGLLQCVAGEG